MGEVRAVVKVEDEDPVTVLVLAERIERRQGQIIVLGEEEVARATGDTVWDALRDCAKQLELASQGIAQGGTVTSSSGRPPGH